MQPVGHETIRRDLCGRIAALDRPDPRRTPAQFACEVDAIRSLARRHGLAPAATVAHLLGDVLARGEHGALVHGWLAVLADAVGCERTDAQACDAYAAVCSVRLAA